VLTALHIEHRGTATARLSACAGGPIDLFRENKDLWNSLLEYSGAVMVSELPFGRTASLIGNAPQAQQAYRRTLPWSSHSAVVRKGRRDECLPVRARTAEKRCYIRVGHGR
jgi:hypothetical protein